MRIKTVYGPHPSRCFGLSLGIDPILPPKRCIYNCIYCPMGRTISHVSSPSIMVTPERVKEELVEFIVTNGCIFENIMIWGMGDPLLNYHTPLIAKIVRETVREHGCLAGIVVRTTGFHLGGEWVRPLYDFVDEVVIPVDSVGDERKIINNPIQGHGVYRLANIIKQMPRFYKKKIAVEINLLRYNGSGNYVPSLIHEVMSILDMMNMKKIYLKTVSRPGSSDSIKPVRGGTFAKIMKLFIDNGFNVVTCTDTKRNNVFYAGDIREALLNHLLRKPLSSDEIALIYGNEGLVEAEKMVEAGFLAKKPWCGKIFFRIKTVIDIYSTSNSGNGDQFERRSIF